MLCGGTSQTKPACDEILALCVTLREELENKAGKKFTEFSAIEYQSQVVAGTNYFVKIHIGNEEYIHARIFKPLSCNGTTPEVHGVQMSKSKADAITYF
jgi:cystatin-A/B